MIIVLRKLYEEQAEQLRLAADPAVTVGEVREEYRTITGKERDLGVIQYETLLRWHIACMSRAERSRLITCRVVA